MSVRACTATATGSGCAMTINDLHNAIQRLLNDPTIDLDSVAICFADWLQLGMPSMYMGVPIRNDSLVRGGVYYRVRSLKGVA